MKENDGVLILYFSVQTHLEIYQRSSFMEIVINIYHFRVQRIKNFISETNSVFNTCVCVVTFSGAFDPSYKETEA